MVTWNTARDLAVSLTSATDQRGLPVEVVVVDNASSDTSVAIVQQVAPAAKLIRMPENVGFAAAMNAGIHASSSRYVLALNPDCRLEPDFARILSSYLDERPTSGSASGRLVRGSGPSLEATDVLDSTGIVFSATWRHFDRGAGEPASDQFTTPDSVVGPSGAAGFYRRKALESVRISTGIFDEDFFTYREDADLALRLRRVGWQSHYVPDAVAYHRRANTPERRRSMSALVNFHSTKNCFLLRINNQSRVNFVRTLLPTTARDIVVLAACLTVERSSLPAFSWLWGNRKRLLMKRREIAALAHVATGMPARS